MVGEVEEKIEQLDGVISCKVKGKNEIEEIHIVAYKNRKPKRIVRDIETMVFVNLDRQISHKKISIAQIDSSSSQAQRNRVELISVSPENNSSACNFKLKVNENLIEERMEGSPGLPLTLTVAEGLLEIIERYTTFEGKLRVENVFTNGIKNEIVTVQLVLHHSGRLAQDQRLVASTYIDKNLPLATGKACLKAINRQLANYI